MPARRAWLSTVVLLIPAIVGCVSPQDAATTASVADAPALDGVLPIAIENVMTFAASVVKPAVAVASDLYEPTVEVSDTGTLYVAAHVIGAATTGTPAYYSTDDGKSWAQLPFAASVASPVQGATPPPGDEGVIVAGEKGQAWMADIYAYGFSVTGWCDNGKTQCYDDRQAYDRARSSTTQCAGGTGGTTIASVNDRPWAAYASGTIVMVNNAGGGPLQIGVMKVPPPQPLGFMSVNGPEWNLCASKGGSIPSSISMRADGLFAATQSYGSGKDQVMDVTIGNARDIAKVETKEAFHFTSAGSGAINGASAFDKAGTLFVAARNNTLDKPGQPSLPVVGGGTPAVVKDGRIILAASTDDGATFKTTTFSVGTATQTLYLDSNPSGDGVLVVWSQVATDKAKSDWFVAHAFVGADGAPELRDVSLAIDEGPRFVGDVFGAGVGPDGRAYFVTFDAAQAKPGGTPLSVWIQKDGSTLPVGTQG